MPGASKFGKVNTGTFEYFRSADGSIDTAGLFSLALLISRTPVDEAIQSTLLERTGEVITASSIFDARSLLQMRLAELVVLVIDGEETELQDFLRELKKLRPDLPILLITPQDTRNLLSLINLGAWDFAESSKAAVIDALQRLAGRKLTEMQKMQSQIEWSAFWAAVHNAPDGVGILGSTGTVLFANRKFLDFCSAVARIETGPNPDLPALLKGYDPSAAGQLEEQLKERSTHVAWQTEVKIDERYFCLFLSSVTFGELGELSALSENVRIAAPRLFVLWMRDITGAGTVP